MTGRSGSQGTESESNPPADAAEYVPGYRDLARIGHGGFSVVYRAVQESFERSVALKVLTDAGGDPDARRRFLREVRLASRLSGHPHVVTVLDTGETTAGRLFLVMDLYEGGSMKAWLRRCGPLPAAETAMVGAKIAEALAAAHSLGVLHRDVKPNNILVSRFGEPALADFGVSCLLDSSSSASVLDVFSPQHAAPELMARGVPSVSSDVYALGSTLYELLTGRSPFGAEGRDVRSIMWAAMSEPAPRPDCPELPELADAIVRALAKEPEDRFPDAAEFARTLRALIPEGAAARLAMPNLSRTVVMVDAPDPEPSQAGGLAAAAGGLEVGAAESDAEAGSGPESAESGESAEFAESAEAEPVPGPQPEAESESGSEPDAESEPELDPGPDPKPEPESELALIPVPAPDATLTGQVPDATSTGHAPDATATDSGPDDTATGRARGTDETMVRPDRADLDAVAAAEGGRGNGLRRARKPLALLVLLGLLGVVGWLVFASQGSSTPPATEDASAHHVSVTASAHASPDRSAARPTTRSAAPAPTYTEPTTAAASKAVSSTTVASSSSAPTTAPSAASSSGSVLSGLGTYYRFRNAQSGGCLMSPAAQSACGSSASEGWEYSEPLTGLLSAVAGEYELVNKQSGECLTAGSGGQVTAETCGSETSQLWTTVPGSDSANELRNAENSLCLQASGGAVVDGTCSTSDGVDLWAQDGTV